MRQTRFVHEMSQKATEELALQATRKGWPYYTRANTPSYIVGPPLVGGLRRAPRTGGLERRLLPPIFALLLFLLTGCQFTQSPFVITVGNAGAEFAAASTTLTYVHTNKISIQYAQASFMNYQSQLSGLDQQLPSQQGAPDKRTLEHLLALYRPAMRAVNHPCLAEGCNWRAQVTLLDRASQAFLKAGGQ
ncbi:MAG TPA: hypothetical protein VFQ30_20430 [Ktedonobacteraceae bacterium]|nr:hypothetical protein [Ktedonobacteraceae bacterium]